MKSDCTPKVGRSSFLWQIQNIPSKPESLLSDATSPVMMGLDES